MPDHHPLHQRRLAGGLVTDNTKPLDAYSGLLLSVTYWVNMFDVSCLWCVVSSESRPLVRASFHCYFY
jgi:hypothetical protein